VFVAVVCVFAGCGDGPAEPEAAAPREGSVEHETSVEPEAEGGPATYENPRRGFSVSFPAGWQRAEGGLSSLIDPVETLVVATYRPRPDDHSCGPLAFAGFDADEALVILLERGLDPSSEWPDFPPRPRRFEYEPGMTSEFTECLRTTRGIPLRDHWFRFTDAGRHFHVLVAIGADAPAETGREAYRILDSLWIDPAVRPDWRSAG
jgi:hypothetical protein